MSLEVNIARNVSTYLGFFAGSNGRLHETSVLSWQKNELGNDTHRVISSKNARRLISVGLEQRYQELENELKAISQNNVKNWSDGVFTNTLTGLAYTSIALSLFDTVISKNQGIINRANNAAHSIFEGVGLSMIASYVLRDFSKPVIKMLERNKHNKNLEAFIKSERIG